MMEQLAFPEPNARRTDPGTSHAAARDAARTADTLREQCYRALVAAGPAGLTDFELADIVGRQQTSAGKRRGELVAAGRALPTLMRRPAPSGSSAIVWRAVTDEDIWLLDVENVDVANDRL